MKNVNATIQNLWQGGGPFIGDAGAAHSRVTVEKDFVLQTTGQQVGNYSKGPVRWFQRKDNSQIETEIPNVLSINIDRTLDSDAATCKIVIGNQQMRTNNASSTDPKELGQPGYFTFNRGSAADGNARWGQSTNEWRNILVPNALLRTYQGYGGRSKTIVQAATDGNIYLTGVWLVDEVQITTDGRITLSCRDMAKLLIDQSLYPPLVPRTQYPLQYCRYYYSQRVVTTPPSYQPRRLAYEYSGNELWYGGGGSVHGHNPRDANDGNPATFWLSVGNVRPTEPYATEWLQYDCQESINSVTILPFAGNYKCYVSVMENGVWQGTGEVVPYAPAGVGRYNGTWNAKIPAVMSFGVPWEQQIRVMLPRVYQAQKVRLSFTNLQRSQWGPYPYRAGVREVSVGNDTQGSSQTITERADGNYTDYADIIKDLLLWSGFYLWNFYDFFRGLFQGPKDPPKVYGNIETTGAYAYATTCIPPDTFDKLPVIDAINHIKQIVGYHFWIDDAGGARFESPNWWVPGNYFESGNHTTTMYEIDEKLQITQYGVSYKDHDARSEIIVATAEPTLDLKNTVTSRYVPPTASVLKGLVRVGMFAFPLEATQEEADIMARLIGLHSFFALRQGSLTCPANPAIQVNDQVRIYERQTGESYIHYVRGLSTQYDAVAGTYTMTLTTHWLGDQNQWAFDVNAIPPSDPLAAWIKKIPKHMPVPVPGPNTNLTTDQLAYTRYADEVMFDTPVAYWRFADTTGTTVAEQIAAANGTYNGFGVTLAQPSLIHPNGRFNDPTLSASFDGLVGYATLPAVALSTNGSIEAVINWTAGPTVMRDSTSGSAGWIFLTDNGGNLAYRIAGTTYTTGTPTTSARGGAHHVVLTKAGTTVKLYLDGTLVHTGTGAPSTPSTTPWVIARDGNDANFAAVTVDELAIYNAALDPTRVTVHYKGFAGQKK